MNLKEEIKKIYTKTGKINSGKLNSKAFKSSKLFDLILSNTNFLDEKTNFAERFFCILNNITECPLCEICGLRTKTFLPNKGRGYSETCNSRSCIQKNYHKKNGLNFDFTKDKREISRKKFQHFALNNTIILSYLDVLFFLNNLSNNNSNWKYNENNFLIIYSLIEYTKEIPFDINKFDTDISKRIYCFKNNITIPICPFCDREKKFINRIKGFALSCGSIDCRTKSSANIRIEHKKEKVEQKLNDEGFSLVNYNKLNDEYPIILQCPKGHLFERFLKNGKWNERIICHICHPITYSFEEKEVLNFVKQHYDGLIEENYKIPNSTKEIDIFIPALNFGIEYNGLYWHSFDKKETKEEKERHLTKTKLCRENNIHLIQILCEEWKNKGEIIKSLIFSYLNKNKKIYARKTKIEQVEYKEVKTFLNENHIQGECKSSINYILKYNNEIIGVMTFGKSRFNKNAQWEIFRFCYKNGFNVIGGASKLLKKFINDCNPNNIITYSDARLFNGRVYEKLGFKKMEDTPPNYYYIKKKNNNQYLIFNRMVFQKHKLKDKLNLFDPLLTESENMFINGYRRLWDCGQTKWIWEKN